LALNDIIRMFMHGGGLIILVALFGR